MRLVNENFAPPPTRKKWLRARATKLALGKAVQFLPAALVIAAMSGFGYGMFRLLKLLMTQGVINGIMAAIIMLLAFPVFCILLGWFISDRIKHFQ